MLRIDLLAGCSLSLVLLAATPAIAQDLQDRAVPPPAEGTVPPASPGAPNPEDQVRFSAGQLEYDTDADIVTATGDVRMVRQGQRLRADKVTWNRKTGKVLADGDVAVTNPEGDIAYGDSIELTDSLKDGVVDNMLVVLEQGGRLAAVRGTRQDDGTLNLDRAAYTPCAVQTSDGCPKNPSWKITAVRVTYRPERQRVYFSGARMHLFG
ncbi:LPS-assembly protein LptD, partial [uncultured Sphingomonas sp.]|uniref:LPS-assembly protein LptD n=1 Tax=uncultured Sphingomonas sp. TaxID=158754 RepID=UPI00345DB683